MEKITAKTNSIVKDTKKLFASSAYRYKKGMFVLEGARLCFDVLNSLYTVDTLLFTESIFDKYPEKIEKLMAVSDRAYIISDEIADKLSLTTTAQGIFAVVKMNNEKNSNPLGKLIALDNVQDPSNVGAIVRSAEALGIDGIISYNSCDIYNPKAIRASMGSLLRMKVIPVQNLEHTLEGYKNSGYKVYSTVPDGDAEKITDVSFPENVICIIGNEANGVEPEIKALSDDLITIPMLGRAESLNAGIAASITMWEMVRND